MTGIRQRLVSLSLLLGLSLTGLLSGCGSIMSSAGAGPIEEDPGERTFGQQMTDESIETKAKVNINAADEGYDDAHLSIVSFNGFVLLAGQVPSEALKTLATDVVKKLRTSAESTMNWKLGLQPAWAPAVTIRGSQPR